MTHELKNLAGIMNVKELKDSLKDVPDDFDIENCDYADE